MTQRTYPETVVDIVLRLKDACIGHPAAKIAWPHRLLHDAIDEIERLRFEWKAARNEIEIADGEIDRRHAQLDPLADLVDRFSKALLAKLRLAAANGRSGWEHDDWERQCQQGLLRHVDKGDPRDVAAYCAFMWHHGWITTLNGALAQRQPSLVQRDDIAKTIWLAEYRRATGRERSITWYDVADGDREKYLFVADAILALSPPPQQPPAGSEVREAFRSADELDWRRLFSFLPDSGYGRFWKAVFEEVRVALKAQQAESVLHEDEQGFHHVVKGERVPVSSTVDQASEKSGDGAS